MSSVSELIAKYGRDGHDDGDIIVFMKQYNESGPEYTYAAVRGGGTWYCTDGNRYKWFDLMQEVERDNVGDQKVFYVSELEYVQGGE